MSTTPPRRMQSAAGVSRSLGAARRQAAIERLYGNGRAEARLVEFLKAFTSREQR